MFFSSLSCEDSNHFTPPAISPPKSSNQMHQIHTKQLSIAQDLEIKKGNKKTIILPVKMLWLIDNSGSMKDNITKVQAGIKGFVDALTKNHGLNIKATFVSCSGSIAIYCIDPSLIAHPSITLVDMAIRSYDDLTSAALLLAKDHLFTKATLQKSSINKMTAQTFFNLFRSEGSADNVPYFSADSRDPAPVGIYDHSRINHVGFLQNYFNTNERNVIISVTDEESKLSDVHFINFLKINYGSTDSFRYYGYIDPKADTHSGGSHYQNLAHKLNGKTYDITSASETTYGTFFKDLAKEISGSATVNTFTLKSKCTSVEHILLDGNALNPSLYTCKGIKLTINQSAINTGKKITVKYYVESK